MKRHSTTGRPKPPNILDKRKPAEPEVKIPQKWDMETIYFTFSKSGKFLGVFDSNGKLIP